MTRMIVVTPARNESAYLPRLVEAMRRQTRCPDEWAIVDDGSIDGTGKLAEQLTNDLSWVRVVTPDDGARERSHSSKAEKINRVVRDLVRHDTEIIVAIDADMVPPSDFFERVERAFDSEPALGVFGGPCTHVTRRGVEPEPFPPDMVPGNTQAFRRAAFEQIGGYWTLPFSGIDTAACIAAQMHGWISRNDPTLVSEHLRPMGTGEGQTIRRARYLRGRQDYDLGMPIEFQLGKVVRWTTRRPYLTGALWMGAGYLHSWVTRTPRTPSPDFVRFNRRRFRRRLTRRSHQASAP